MDERSRAVDLAERVATIARGLRIETALIGAYALAAHGYVRATRDIDLASSTELEDLRRLRTQVEAEGLNAVLRTPDDQDPLGGVLVVWLYEDADGDPLDPVEVVNFYNPYRPRRTPANDAIKNAFSLEQKPGLRCSQLVDLIALKLYSDSPHDHRDVVHVLVANPDADLDAIRETCKRYGFDRIDELIREAAAQPR